MFISNLNWKEKALIVVWAIILISCYVIATTIATLKVMKDNVELQDQRQNLIKVNTQETGRTWIYLQKLKEGKQEKVAKVIASMYVGDIGDFLILKTNWIVDFYIWYRRHDKKINQGKIFHEWIV